MNANDNLSNAFLEWQKEFEVKIKPSQDPFSPRNNSHYADIEDCSGISN